MWVFVCVRECERACVRMRERERERACVCVRDSERIFKHNLASFRREQLFYCDRKAEIHR